MAAIDSSSLTSKSCIERKRKHDGSRKDEQHDTKRTAIATRDAPSISQTSFLGIPAELRNAIYGQVFTIGDCDPYNPVLAYRGLHSCRCRGQSLMQVSKQIRHETLAMFYEQHEFRLLLSDGHKLALQTWLQSLAPDAFQHIKRFQFRWSEQIEEPIYRPTDLRATFGIGDDGVEVSLSSFPNDRVIEKSHQSGTLRMRRARQLEECLQKVTTSMARVDGKPVLTKKKLLELLRIVGWEPSE